MTRKPKDTERVALVQKDQLEKIQAGLMHMEQQHASLAEATSSHADELAEVDRQIAELYAIAGIERPDTDASVTIDPLASLKITTAEQVEIRRSLPDFSLALDLPRADGRWQDYVAEADAYAHAHRLDMSRDPFETLLNPHDAARIYRKFDADFGHEPWDAWDYSAVGLTVLVASLVDYFLVALPLTSSTAANGVVSFKGEEYRGSPITAWMHEQSRKILSGEGNALQRKLGELSAAAEKYAKVSYDVSINSSLNGDGVAGLRPALHRLMSPGHDPILGFVFGVMDILRGNCTLIDKHGAWQVITPDMRKGEVSEVTSVLEALSLVSAHMFSDIFTPAGLPAPFMTVLQSLNFNSGISVRDGGAPLQVPDLIRYMYAQGYDLRHFATMSLVPVVAEVVIRTYHGVRTWEGGGARGVEGIRGKMKLAKLLLATHALLGCSNILKFGLYGMNPTALNFAQFLALGKQLIVMMMVRRQRDGLVEKQIQEGLEALLESSKELPKAAY